MNRYKKLLNDTLIFAVGNLGSKMILFFLLPLYTNYLTKSQYGTVSLITTAVDLLIPFFSIVFHDAIFRFVLDKKVEVKSVALNGVIVLLCGSILAVTFTPIIGIYKNLFEWKWYVTAYIITGIFMQISMTYVKASERTKLYAVLGIIHTLFLCILNIILLSKVNMQISGYLISGIISNLIIASIAAYKGNLFVDAIRATFDAQLLKSMIAYSSPLIINNVSWWIIHSSDKIMVDYLVGLSAVGLYTVASKIPALINVFISIFSQAWGISSIKEENNDEKIFYSKVFEVYLFLVVFICSSLLMFVKCFMYIYVSESFFDSWRYVPWLLTAAVCSAISSFFGVIYGVVKKSFNVMLSTLITGILNVIFNFYLITRIGAIGAAVSTTIAYLFISQYRMSDTRRFLKFDIDFKKYYGMLFIILIQTICVSMEWHIYSISMLCMAYLIILNKGIVRQILNGVYHESIKIRKEK